MKNQGKSGRRSGNLKLVMSGNPGFPKPIFVMGDNPVMPTFQGAYKTSGSGSDI